MAPGSDIYTDYDGTLTDRELLELAFAVRDNQVNRRERFRSLYENGGYAGDPDDVFDVFEAHGVVTPSPGTGGNGTPEPEPEPDPDVSTGTATGGLDIQGPDPSELRSALNGPEFEALGIDWRPPTESDLAPWGQEGEVPIASDPAGHGYTGTTVSMPLSDFKELQEYIGVDLNPFGPDEGAPTRATFWEFGRGAIEENVEEMAESLRTGEGEVPTPWIEFGRDGSLRDTQEGRNRTLAAERAGLDTIPVRVVYNDEREGEKGPHHPGGADSTPDPGGSTGENTLPDEPAGSEAERADSGGSASEDVPEAPSEGVLAEIEEEIASAVPDEPSGDGGTGGTPDDDPVPNLTEKMVFDHPGVYIITGHRGSGKTMLAYRAAELLAEKEFVLPVTVGLPEHIHSEFPSDWHHVDSISEAPHEAVLVVDEAYDQFHAREAWDEENIGMAGTVNQSRHTGRTIFFITQSTSHLDKTAITEGDGLLMKEPGAFHQNFERQQLRKLLKEAEAEFEDLSDDVNPQKYCFVITNSFRGMIRNDLPTFHSERLSRAYGRQNG